MTVQETMTKEQILGNYYREHTDTETAIYEAMEHYAQQQLSAERERYDELKSKYDAIVMNNMTMEYNAAEAQRHMPDVIKQYVDQERERAAKLVDALKRVDALSFNPTVNRIIKQTLNEYEAATKES